MMSKQKKALRKLLLPVLVVGVLCFIGCARPDELTELQLKWERFIKTIEYCFNNHACKHADEACEKNPAPVWHGKCILNAVSRTFSPQNPVFFRGVKNLGETGEISYFQFIEGSLGMYGVVHWLAHPKDNGSYTREIHVGNNSAYLKFTDIQQEQPTPFWFTTTRLNGVDIVFYREC